MIKKEIIHIFITPFNSLLKEWDSGLNLFYINNDIEVLIKIRDHREQSSRSESYAE